MPGGFGASSPNRILDVSTVHGEHGHRGPFVYVGFGVVGHICPMAMDFSVRHLHVYLSLCLFRKKQVRVVGHICPMAMERSGSRPFDDGDGDGGGIDLNFEALYYTLCVAVGLSM